MPTYDYQCLSCSHTFEKFHAMNYSEKIVCPLCGKMVQKKIAKGSGLIFKGNGFYITDYKTRSKKS